MAKPSLAEALKPSDAPDSEPELEGGPEDSADPMVQAASVIREAIADGDDEALADALRSFVTLGSAASTTTASSKPSLIKQV
jgi:hypothetical protein